MITVVFDNDNITIKDGETIKASGKGEALKTMAKNVIEGNRSKYDVAESNDGHKRIVTLSPKD